MRFVAALDVNARICVLSQLSAPSARLDWKVAQLQAREVPEHVD